MFLKQRFSTGGSRSKRGSWMGCGQLVKRVNNINGHLMLDMAFIL